MIFDTPIIFINKEKKFDLLYFPKKKELLDVNKSKDYL